MTSQTIRWCSTTVTVAARITIGFPNTQHIATSAKK
jgi:hypothetical protein